jgi:hypothetical protein
MRQTALVFLMIFLAACTAETVDPPAATAVPPPATAVIEVALEPTAVPTNPPVATGEPAQVEPTELPSTERPPTAAPEITEIVVEYGRTAEGAFFQGAVEAPITLIDYSDFL